jgi:hypothetical protein
MVNTGDFSGAPNCNVFPARVTVLNAWNFSD